MAEVLFYKPFDRARRAGRRLPFRAGDARHVRLEVGGKSLGEFRVWDLGSGGIALVSGDSRRRFDLPPAGTLAQVFLRWPEGKLALAAVVRRSEWTAEGQARVALAFAPAAAPEDLEASTVPLSAQRPLIATFARPFVFAQQAAADVVRLGAKALILRSKDTSLVLLPQLPLTLQVGGRRVRGKLLWSRPRDGGVEFAIALEGLSHADRRAFVEYLLLTTSNSPLALRAAGLPTRAIRRLFECREVQTQEEYLEVLALRHLTYHGVKKLPAGAPVAASSSVEDLRGRVLGFYHHDQLVGSVSLRFPDEDARVESVERTPGQRYPAHFPPKSSTIEVTKLCIHPDYRGSDLMVGICEQICRVLISSGRQWFLAAADRWLSARYEFIYFRKTGYHYFRTPKGYALERESPQDDRIDVLLSRPFRWSTFGLHSDPLRWNYFARDVTFYSLRSGALRWNALQRFAVFLFLLARPAALLVERLFVK